MKETFLNNKYLKSKLQFNLNLLIYEFLKVNINDDLQNTEFIQSV